MYAKITILADIEIITGMHIGTGDSFSAIGAVDSTVIRDPVTMLPIIPGSSLKGKMRYLLAKYLNKGILLNEPNKDREEVIRMFGNSEKPITRARLKFNDCFMKNADELQKRRVSPTEVKYENTISRKTAVANPRQLERVVRGSIFSMELFYELYGEDTKEVFEDFKNIKLAFRLLEYDYLGGHGTRGSGRIKFNNLKAEAAKGIEIGSFAEPDKLNAILGDADEKNI